MPNALEWIATLKGLKQQKAQADLQQQVLAAELEQKQQEAKMFKMLTPEEQKAAAFPGLAKKNSILRSLQELQDWQNQQREAAAGAPGMEKPQVYGSGKPPPFSIPIEDFRGVGSSLGTHAEVNIGPGSQPPGFAPSPEGYAKASRPLADIIAEAQNAKMMQETMPQSPQQLGPQGGSLGSMLEGIITPELAAAGMTPDSLLRYVITGGAKPELAFERVKPQRSGGQLIWPTEFGGKEARPRESILENVPISVEQPGGRKETVLYPKYGGTGAPAQPRAIETKPPGLTTEATGKVNLIGNAKERLVQAKNLLFDSKGNPNRTIVLMANGPKPIGKGAQLYSKMYQAVDAALRVETGAAQTSEEIEVKMKEFWPSIIDTPETIVQKFSDFEDYINGAAALVDPTGKILKMRDKGKSKEDPLGLR